MIKIVAGDLFESEAQTLVNTVNTVGVMGKGIALDFKRRFPEMYEDYLRRCQRNEVRLGEPYLFRTLFPPWILNFPTKIHWRAVSRLADLVKGVEYLGRHYREWGITSIAVPPLGCGHGQLEWRVVGPALYRHLKELEIPVELFVPFGVSATEADEKFLRGDATRQSQDNRVPRLRAAWVALAEAVARIEREPYRWPIGRTTFQKIAYFATEAGIPTELTFVRGSYGPFSAGLKKIESILVNNGVLLEESRGNWINVRSGPTLRDSVATYSREIQAWECEIERIVDLFLRMKTTDAEIAATVRFVARDLEAQGKSPSELDILHEVQRWKQRRRPPLQEHQIASSIRGLNVLDWITARPSESLPLGESLTS